MDEFNKISGSKNPAFITGKTLENGGSKGRDKATAMGAFYIIQKKYKEEKKEKISVVIQGFGNAGATIAKLLFEAGYKIIAISDSKTGIYNKNGLDINKIYSFIYDGEKKKSLSEISDYEKISNEDLLELKADILIPGCFRRCYYL